MSRSALFLIGHGENYQSSSGAIYIFDEENAESPPDAA
jgi:hypothetical protein